jgi:hypothetical protein
MTKRIFSSLGRRYCTALAALLAIAGIGCSQEPNPEQTGNAEVSVMALSSSDIASVILTISGVTLPAPRTQLLFNNNGRWGGTIGSLPAGDDYTFNATVLDSTGTALYKGVKSNITILPKQTVAVVITANQVEPSDPFKNATPVIDALSIASTKVAPGDVVSVKVDAHDPDPANTLTFTWTASAGVFADPAAAQTTWIAPATEGNYEVSILVQDNLGATASVKANVKVNVKNGRGQAEVTVRLNNVPVVAGLEATPSWLENGVATILAAHASDADGDSLSFAWSSSCVGTFSDGTASTSFVLDAAETATSCTVTVKVSDGTGYETTGELALPVGHPEFNEAPAIVGSTQSSTTADSGEAVTLVIEAVDPEGNTLSFVWSASSGSLSASIDTLTTSHVSWTAPSPVEANTYVTVVVSDARGATTSQTFQIRAIGRWFAGDFHQHTLFTDGSMQMSAVMGPGFTQYGLDYQANSEHGGIRYTDGEGHYWDDSMYYPTNPILGDIKISNGHQGMWRWQSIRDFAYPIILNLRASYANKLVFTGMEWNMPGHEHCSTGIVAQDSTPISQFEYLFDASDADTTGGSAQGWTGKNFTNDHAKAVQGAAWMQASYGNTGWIVPAHPERQKTYKIEHFRDLNNAGPSVAIGFEGMPGHQKSSNRGEYSSAADGGGTYGGAGVYIAQLGGVWDSLLAEGRNWFTYVSSDFHSTTNDYYPGEYAKTWSFVVDSNGDGTYSQEEVVSGIKSGKSFSSHGDLINGLEFRAVAGGRKAGMGEWLSLSSPLNVTVTIRFRVPASNSRGDVPVVDHVDLIAGTITGKVSKYLADGITPNPAYSQVASDSHVLATFRSSDWSVGPDGFATVTAQVPVSSSTFLRLRGTNLAPSTAGETDASGNPLLDPPGTNDGNKPWADLWFYSNPIFVKIAP